MSTEYPVEDIHLANPKDLGSLRAFEAHTAKLKELSFTDAEGPTTALVGLLCSDSATIRHAMRRLIHDILHLPEYSGSGVYGQLLANAMVRDLVEIAAIKASGEGRQPDEREWGESICSTYKIWDNRDPNY